MAKHMHRDQQITNVERIQAVIASGITEGTTRLWRGQNDTGAHPSYGLMDLISHFIIRLPAAAHAAPTLRRHQPVRLQIMQLEQTQDRVLDEIVRAAGAGGDANGQGTMRKPVLRRHLLLFVQVVVHDAVA